MLERGAGNLSDTSVAQKASIWCLFFSIVMETVQVLGFGDRNSRHSPAIYKPCDVKQDTEPLLDFFILTCKTVVQKNAASNSLDFYGNPSRPRIGKPSCKL